MTVAPLSPGILRQALASGPEAVGEDRILDLFLDFVSSRGLTMYPAQEEAILSLYDGANLILNTPTGSGKSLVATALHWQSLIRGRRSIYTCPIKALVNEKFLALCQDFGAEYVGMVTGDAAINTRAPIICCTAEILMRQALREGADAKVDDVIMDEFHYYADKERGVAWQVPLLTLANARFLLMSATLGPTEQIEASLTRLNGRATQVIRSIERPVPLRYQYVETPLHETVHDLVITARAPVYLVCFTQREAAEEAQNLLSVDICSKDEKQNIARALSEIGIRFSSPYGKEFQKILRHGVGLHHAGLLPKYRLVVERLAQRGLLKVICGTDTLGVGVNIPIRSVLLSKLCKFDGEKTGILSVRDFRQISGRAGRRGFDTEGFVVVQAPAHVIENLRTEAKFRSDPKKAKKAVKAKPPERGFVMWTRETFDRLTSAEPEPLVSQFRVTHGMILDVLAQEGDGCRALKGLIDTCHDSAAVKARHRTTAMQMFRSLVERRIIEIIPVRERVGPQKLRVQVDLQEDFSIHHALALYLIDTVKLCDPYSETYALDILTLAESIVEDPELILRRQLDRLKGEKIAAMKAEGMEYDQRMEELEKLEYPKPNREFIYDTFNTFAAAHPWVGQDNIRPKSVAREMFEDFSTFHDYIRDYDLQRSEGLLLRYLAEVYKVLLHTVPAAAKDDLMAEIIEYLAVMIRQVDSTLLDEWEKLKKGVKAEDLIAAASAGDSQPVESFDITRSQRGFAVAIRNEVFQYVKALAVGRVNWVVEAAAQAGATKAWTGQELSDLLATYRSDHEGPLTDRAGRSGGHFRIITEPSGAMTVEQVLADREGHNDWFLRFFVDIEGSRQASRAIVRLEEIAPVSS